ncbi:anti-sigma factor [Defluviimonas sp. SAOS-178_SWC]|uniref:anti-sigma factor n=1 Tax=Defluviimonas sp. SAOS-178_SWC TaxID=3121287 RepID=UPI0032221337
MSDPVGHMPEREALAAEYVLGTLPLEKRLTAEALIEGDPGFAAMVEDWQNRLAPLNEGYAEMAPPADLLDRVEARLFPTPEQPRRRGFWIWGALAGAALAAIAAIVILPTLTPDAPVTATLTGEGQDLAVAARFDARTGELTVSRAAGPAAAPGKDYELWLIPAGEAPISIGLVRDAELTIPVAALPAGTTLAITLEPEGGSPTGVATGPLLVAAEIGDA